MAKLEVTYESDVLGMARNMTVILPQRSMRNMDLAGLEDGTFPVLYLLHGLSDNHEIWCRYTSLERYLTKLPLVVVMPDVNRSFYSDMHQGYRYFTHISEELPRICKGFFPISDKREHTFIAGLSMGGYGALKIAMRSPDRYSAVASMSGCLDLRGKGSDWESVPGEGELVFGPPDSFVGSPNDIVHIAQNLAASGEPQPKMYACCGTEDYLIETGRSFTREAKAAGLEIEYEEDDGYAHSWDYWDLKIQKVLSWLMPTESEE